MVLIVLIIILAVRIRKSEPLRRRLETVRRSVVNRVSRLYRRNDEVSTAASYDDVYSNTFALQSSNNVYNTKPSNTLAVRLPCSRAVQAGREHGMDNDSKKMFSKYMT